MPRLPTKTPQRPIPRPGDPLYGNPEWEAMKARCRNLTPSQAVRESASLSEQYRRRHRMPDIVIEFDRIIETLIAKKIPFVLTGAHGIANWTGRPRSTHDVDILVKTGRNYGRAVKAMQALYPQLELRVLAGVAAFFVPGETESVIDVTYPHRHDIGETLATAIWIVDKGRRYRIPALEAALANKYGAMLTPTRDPGKRGMDMVDFYTMVKHSQEEGRAPIDIERVAELGELVWPGGGGAEIVRFVEQAKAGEVPNPNERLKKGPSANQTGSQ
jgi:hypothetical protein